jgi:hypothetical protein
MPESSPERLLCGQQYIGKQETDLATLVSMVGADTEPLFDFLNNGSEQWGLLG